MKMFGIRWIAVLVSISKYNIFPINPHICRIAVIQIINDKRFIVGDISRKRLTHALAQLVHTGR